MEEEGEVEPPFVVEEEEGEGDVVEVVVEVAPAPEEVVAVVAVP